MRKYIQTPNLQAWQMYYEYIDNNTTYQEIGVKYGVTRERVRQLVTKVQRYLRNDNITVLTRERVQEIVKRCNDFLNSVK